MKKGMFFSILYRSASSPYRFRCVRKGVKKHLKGGSMGYKPKDHKLVVLWDRNGGGYKAFKLACIDEFRVSGQTIKNRYYPAIDKYLIEAYLPKL